jgi:hypothetical protein
MNMQFLNDNIKENNEKQKEIKREIKKLEEKIKKREEMNQNNIDGDIQTDIYNEQEDLDNLVSNSNIELKDISDENNDYKELISCIRQNKINIAKEYAEKLKEKNLAAARDKLLGHKVGAIASGIIPLFDLLIEHFIKKDARETIAKEFHDSLTEFDDHIELSKKEKEFIDIEQIKKDTSDNPTDVIKTGGKIGSWAFCFLCKFSNYFKYDVPIIGTIAGMTVNYDINKYLEFYGRRLVYRYLVTLSFEEVKRYLEDNFKNQEKSENKDLIKTKD